MAQFVLKKLYLGKITFPVFCESIPDWEMDKYILAMIPDFVFC